MLLFRVDEGLQRLSMVQFIIRFSDLFHLNAFINFRSYLCFLLFVSFLIDTVHAKY